MQTVEERALALVNAVQELRGHPPLARFRSDTTMAEALMQSIKAHDAFKQEVSDAVNGFERYCTVTDTPFPTDLSRFILPKPVDPLVEAIREASVSDADDGDASRLRAALAKRGGRIVFKEVGDV